MKLLPALLAGGDGADAHSTACVVERGQLLTLSVRASPAGDLPDGIRLPACSCSQMMKTEEKTEAPPCGC